MNPDTIIVEEEEFWRRISADEKCEVSFSAKAGSLKKEFQMLSHVFSKIIERRSGSYDHLTKHRAALMAVIWTQQQVDWATYVHRRISELIVKEKTNTTATVKGIFKFKKTFGLVVRHLLSCLAISLREKVFVHSTQRFFITEEENKALNIAKKAHEAELRKAGVEKKPTIKRKAVISPTLKKTTKKGKKTQPTLLRDSETVGSTTTPPKSVDVEGEVNQEVSEHIVAEKVVEKKVDEIVEKEKAVEKVDQAVVSAEKEVFDIEEVAKTSEII
ncbi:hypothetical protein Dimus_022963 [Dionaea muscipula]